MKSWHLALGRIIAPATVRRAGSTAYPVLSMTMRDGLVNQADKFKKRIASADTSSYKVVEKNQLVVGFPIDEGVLAFQHLHDEAIVSPAYNIWNLQDHASVDSRYLERFLRSPRALAFYASKLRSTTARRRSLPNDIFLSLSVPVPPLAEQERIVKLLDEADELRKLRAQADRRTTALIPALFHDMFGDPLENLRGWPSHPVSSFVAELQGGRNVNPAGADEAAGRLRVLKISAVTWGAFQPKESKPVPAGYEPPASHFARAGDLLFSRANTTELVAATSYVFETPPNLLLPDKLWRFVWKEPRAVEPQFVWWLFQAASVRRELRKRATGTGGSMKNIAKPKVMSLEVPIPPLPLQREFVRRATEIRAMEANQAASRRRVDDLFQSMLHRAFNGEP